MQIKLLISSFYLATRNLKTVSVVCIKFQLDSVTLEDQA